MKNALLLSLFMSISLSVNADFLKMSNDAEILEHGKLRMVMRIR